MPATYPPPVEPSATIEMGDRARELREAGHEVENLGSGTPDLETPTHISEAGATALGDGHTKLTRTAGITPLREAIAEKFTVENDVETSPEDVAITPGSKFGLYAAIVSLVREGDEVISFDPAWVSYDAMVDLAGGSVRSVPLDPESGFSLDVDALTDTMSDDTRALILNNPLNPTGTVFTSEELAAIRDLAVEHDVWVIVDEIYEKLTYGVEHVSIGSLDGMADRTVTTNGFSKAYAMSGWRLGYATGPASVIDSIQTFQSQTASAAPSVSQHAGVAALSGPQEPVSEMREVYRDRIDAVMDVLTDAEVTVSRPDGAFYVFVPTADPDDVAVAEAILENEQIATTPGSAFGVSGYIRIACTVPTSTLEPAVQDITGYLA